ncbi:hypothetical protein HELRODRAFT_171905 [Helobdella robusta]|uniref:Uncharacterized protein n=1 Tax=Helobdella robusta TaxID=6412 RepID=T1F4T6_HELRO|nr:hypothetical protein HELRODRAFT_171905 [Helobdella robusta]ESO04903.1 hypothetical protein HELRODRAFT_171905 [Helobdella robusta]
MCYTAYLMIIFVMKTFLVNASCVHRLEENNVSFCSCDPAIEDRSWSTFSFLEALMLCSMRCSQTASCVAYNFFSATNQCQLFNQTLNKFSVMPGCQYYYRKDLSATDKNLTIDVDNQLEEIYINGINVMSALNFPHASEWNIPDVYHLRGDLFVIAVKVYNDLYSGGVVIHTADNYILTNNTWKCTNNYADGWYKIIYNDSFWPAANEFLNPDYKGYIGNAKWIYGPNKCEYCKFFCRKSFLSNF